MSKLSLVITGGVGVIFVLIGFGLLAEIAHGLITGIIATTDLEGNNGASVVRVQDGDAFGKTIVVDVATSFFSIMMGRVLVREAYNSIRGRPSPPSE